MRRRTFIQGATVLVGAGVTAGPVFAEGEAAFTPWEDWRGTPQEGPLALVRAAILAANVFNTQPWLFKVSSERIELYADTKRELGMFDRYQREMHLSLGCALENLVLAAGARGYSASVSLLPNKLALPVASGSQLVARVDLARSKPVASELYDAIPHRHTNRDPYDAAKSLPAGFAEALARLPGEEPQIRLFVFTDSNRRTALADAIVDAGKINMADPHVRDGIQPWLRANLAQTLAARDGEPTYRTAPAPPSMSYKDLLLTAPLFGIVAVRDRYDGEQALRAGRVWQRAHLLATARGLAARPENSAVQRIDHEREAGTVEYASRIAAVTGDATWQPTLMFYMGHPTAQAPIAARRPVSDVTL